MVKLEISRYGTWSPTYYLSRDFVRRAGFRARAAACYEIAARIETASEGESWCVQIDRDRGCVYLELAEDDKIEAARAMALLVKLEAE